MSTNTHISAGNDSVVDYRLAYRLSRAHDFAFLKSLSHSGDMEQALLSRDLKAWLAENHIEPLDIISKLHLLLHKETDERKRHFGFQYRSKAMAFHIVYIDKFAWSKGKYRERKTGENQRKVQRMLHLFMFDEIHRSKSQRLKIVKDMMLEPETAGELA